LFFKVRFEQTFRQLQKFRGFLSRMVPSRHCAMVCVIQWMTEDGMGYAVIGLVPLGFAMGVVSRLEILVMVVALLLPFSMLFARLQASGFLDAMLTIMIAQTILQTSYFLGLLARAAFEAFFGPRPIDNRCGG
jgi:hypothetical protein